MILLYDLPSTKFSLGRQWYRLHLWLIYCHRHTQPVQYQSSRSSCSNSTTVWTGDYLEVDIPKSVLHHDGLLAVEPHLPGSLLTPFILHSVGNKICIENTSNDPVTVRKHEHFCDAAMSLFHQHSTINIGLKSTLRHAPPYASLVTVDPDNILPS